MSAPTGFALDFTARLDLDADDDVTPSSWFITHGSGKPAQGTYTEVRFGPDALAELLVLPYPLEPGPVLEQLVREVAVQLYGTAYAFTYPPEQRDDAIDRWALRRREVVVVHDLEAWPA